jgi:5-methylcytosine-specific restriction endonuclease McrA
MKKVVLEPLIQQGLSLRVIARTLDTSPSNARYWIRKYGLKLKQKPFGTDYVRPQSSQRCGHCGETDPTKFYGRKRTVCGTCHNKYTLQAGQNKRSRAIEQHGGQCQVCGFDKYHCSLDFHHKNPSVKSPSYSSLRGWSWERILLELEKCILLCKNCHAAVHAGLLQVDKFNIGA